MHPAYWEQAMGGAELQIKLLVEQLIMNNYTVSFIFEDKGLPYSNELKINLIPLKKIAIKKTFGSRWIFFHRKLFTILQKQNPDIIYTRFYSSWSGVASVFAKRNNKFHIWALASDSDLKNKPVSILRPFDIIEKKWVSKAFKDASLIITQNNYQQNELKVKYNRQGFLFPQSAICDTTNTFQKDSDKLKICWIANLKSLKRPDLFLQLVKSMANNKSIEFFMIGRPHKEFKEQIKAIEKNNNNFHYLGELSNDNVNKILSSSHILINTSDYEGFSNTFVQAWMRKVVVISFNSNPDEILTKEDIGFVNNNLEEVVEIILSLSNNRDLLAKKAEKAFHYAHEYHSYERNFKKLLKLIEYQ